MFNLVPKRIPSVNLLYGKRPIQRIEVGRGKHRLEVPLSAVEDLYKSVDTTKQYHNGDYHPLRWKSFLNLKLKAYYLYQAAHDTNASKTAMRQLSFFPKLTALYKAQVRNTQADVAMLLNSNEPLYKFPIQGKDVLNAGSSNDTTK